MVSFEDQLPLRQHIVDRSTDPMRGEFKSLESAHSRLSIPKRIMVDPAASPPVMTSVTVQSKQASPTTVPKEKMLLAPHQQQPIPEEEPVPQTSDTALPGAGVQDELVLEEASSGPQAVHNEPQAEHGLQAVSKEPQAGVTKTCTMQDELQAFSDMPHASAPEGDGDAQAKPSQQLHGPTPLSGNGRAVGRTQAKRVGPPNKAVAKEMVIAETRAFINSISSAIQTPLAAKVAYKRASVATPTPTPDNFALKPTHRHDR